MSYKSDPLVVKDVVVDSLVQWVGGVEEVHDNGKAGDKVGFGSEGSGVQLGVCEEGVASLDGVIAQVGDAVSHTFVPHVELIEGWGAWGVMEGFRGGDRCWHIAGWDTVPSSKQVGRLWGAGQCKARRMRVGCPSRGNPGRAAGRKRLRQLALVLLRSRDRR